MINQYRTHLPPQHLIVFNYSNIFQIITDGYFTWNAFNILIDYV